ncbi:hypothetical protein ZIOFF_008695 [Zingiber officinale]|uniref:Uncharacterized protein n=1 Tax=Zingiber officinale TaxID=94328 RepID=A0A8J5I6Y7_ZINOF|nr:hypothetical protein ZIOFF_008689 [Zingiber officinale]KAG6534792.1 hypothetical protein ZIOFF_008695 [Zingiber officinale]
MHASLFLCSLILAIATSQGFARAAGRKRTVGVVVGSLGRCKPEKAGSCPETNSSLVEDDKRIVPTGSNPLHNYREIWIGFAFDRDTREEEAMKQISSAMQFSAQLCKLN